MFEPRLALSSLSGASDAQWASAGAEYAGAAFLGGIAICRETREAARGLLRRGREEFLPVDPLRFMETQLQLLDGVDIRPGVNLRTVDTDRLRSAAELCAASNAIVEVNAHCRQAEMCQVGAGETLLADTERLAHYVGVAAESGADVSVKVRTEVDGVDLVETAAAIERAGASIIHVDAMDSEPVIADISGHTTLFVIANNGVRDRASVEEYLSFGADAVSVGRPSDQTSVLARVHRAVQASDELMRESVTSPPPERRRQRQIENDRTVIND